MSQRLAYILCLLTVAGILATGVYLEVVEGIMPCPLCTLQRICFGICGLLSLLGVFLYQKRLARIIINMDLFFFATIGFGLAARQLWIQFFPSPDNSECGVSINYMLTVLPIKDVASKIFSGSTECSQRGWELLNLNIPEWSLLFFGVFMTVSLVYLIKDFRNKG
jgi:disulfide bond formation protein DsbB